MTPATSAVPAPAPDAPLYFTDMVTLRAHRASYDAAASITIATFQSLISAVLMREDLSCQLSHRDGGRCNHWFRRGWLARRKDGVEVIIGGDCAQKHFNASETFRLEKRRLSREIAVEGHLTALAELLRDRSAVRSRITALLTRLAANGQQLRALEDALPTEVPYRLAAMAKDRRGRVEVEVQYAELNEDGKEEKKWRRRDVGTIVGLLAWEGPHAKDLYPRLRMAEFAARDAVLRADQALDDLKKWREALEQVPHCDDTIAQLERALAEFTTIENLALLCFLVKNEDAQRAITRLVLERSGIGRPTDMKVQDTLNQWKKRVREQHGGLNIRTA